MNIILPIQPIKYTKGNGWCTPVRFTKNGKEQDYYHEISMVINSWGPALDKYGNLGMSVDLTDKPQAKDLLDKVYNEAKEAVPAAWTAKEKNVVFSEPWSEDYPNSLFLKFWQANDTMFTKCVHLTENGFKEITPEEIKQGSLVSVKFKITISCLVDTKTKSASLTFQNKLTMVKVMEMGAGQTVTLTEEEVAYLETKKQKLESPQPYQFQKLESPQQYQFQE